MTLRNSRSGLPILTIASPVRAISTAFTLSHVTVISPKRGRWANQQVQVQNGHIATVTDASDTTPLADALHDYDGMYVLPGLVDLHTHLPPDNALKLTPYLSLLYLLHGVTTVRDTGDGDGTAVTAAQKGILSDQFPGPRVFFCGPYIGGEPKRWPNTIIMNEPQDAKPIVEQIKAQGATCIKAYDNLTLPLIAALREAADAYNLPLIGHVPTALSYEEALIPNVQHFFGVPRPEDLMGDTILNRLGDWDNVDEARLDQIVEVSLRHGIINTPTLDVTEGVLRYADYEAARQDPLVRLMPALYPDIVWHPQKGNPSYQGITSTYLARLADAFSKKLALVNRLHSAGAALRLGTDVQQPFIVPGVSLQREMRLFVQAGIPVSQVWELATYGAGQELRETSIGVVQTGAHADLLVFEQDPTENLDALGTLRAVIAQGKLYPIDQIHAAIATYQNHFAHWPFAPISRFATQRAMKRMFQEQSG